ncbi:MAG: hypothetical protein IPM50_00685 [Acidobacteriota bacterium]|nr:MAG: hypothetical protein IPM50_00685 [Acidobacteriota bacterium]
MREFLLVFAVIAVLLGLTAIKYRRQLMAMVGFARLLKEAGSASGDLRKKTATASEPNNLVSCVACGVWIPESKVIRKGSRNYCSEACVKA